MSATPWCHLDAPDLTRLDLAAVVIREALDTPYLVGSVLTTPTYRDVDVRVILDDRRYKRLFRRGRFDPLRHVLEVAFTEHLVRHTGLRIDFQIQSMEQAEDYPGKRHPLGLYPHPAQGRSKR